MKTHQRLLSGFAVAVALSAGGITSSQAQDDKEGSNKQVVTKGFTPGTIIDFFAVVDGPSGLGKGAGKDVGQFILEIWEHASGSSILHDTKCAIYRVDPDESGLKLRKAARFEEPGNPKISGHNKGELTIRAKSGQPPDPGPYVVFVSSVDPEAPNGHRFGVYEFTYAP